MACIATLFVLNLNLNKMKKKFISFVKDRPYNDKRYSISSLKIRKLGWKPKFNLIKELPKIIQWYSDNLYLYMKYRIIK